MEALYAGERYWFDSADEQVITEHNRGFENKTPLEQFFLVYYRAAVTEEEGEWLLAAEIAQRVQRNSKMRFSPGQITYFGRILAKQGVESRRKSVNVLLCICIVFLFVVRV